MSARDAALSASVGLRPRMRTRLHRQHVLINMGRQKLALFLILQCFAVQYVSPAKQQVQLSDSYLPVAMQIIAHLTDQMAFETKDDVTPTARPTTTTKPASRPSTTTSRPSTTTFRPISTFRPSTTTSRSTTWQYVTSSFPFKPTTNGWWFTTSKRPDQTTPFHKPGIYAPFSPPRPFINRYQSRNFLLPIYNHQYTVLEPEETRSEDPFLSIQEEEVQPLIEPNPDSPQLLPPHFDVKISARSDGFTLDGVDDENLQYLSEDVREMIKMAKNPNDERVVDVWERAGAQPVTTKAKMSSSNLRLLLLYDLLSRDAKRQRLSDYHGFSPEVMKTLVESSTGGARHQLRTALSKMVERKDCGHDYANNRAKEMVEELAKDESKLSSEIRYLQPLIYKY